MMRSCFRRSSKHIADPQIVCALFLRLDGQFFIVRRYPYDLIRSQKFPCRMRRYVALSQMNAVGIHRHRDIDPVIDNKRNLIRIRNLFYIFCNLQKFPSCTVFLAELNDRHTPLYSKLHCFFQSFRRHQFAVCT